MALDGRPISGVSVFAVVVDGGGFVKAADATTRRCTTAEGIKVTRGAPSDLFGWVLQRCQAADLAEPGILSPF
jgi:hypothetical protein